MIGARPSGRCNVRGEMNGAIAQRAWRGAEPVATKPMKTNLSPQSILAGVGAVSLLIYVLACATSFSPDDRQVLYPTFDPRSGATSVALYDRQTGRSEVLFTAAVAEFATNQQPVLLRAEWLPDGKHILIASVVRDEGINLLVLPRGVQEPVRQFSLSQAGKDSAATSLEFPFAVAGSQLFLNGEGRNPLRLDLVTGELAGGEKAENEVFALPAPDGKTILGLRDRKTEGGMEYGTIDPQTVEFKSLGQVGTNGSDGTLPAFNPTDGRLMFIAKSGEQLQLQVRKNGQTELTRQLARDGEKLQVGTFLDLARDGKTVLSAYCAVQTATTNTEYGLLEIPLSEAPLRFTPLFHGIRTEDAELLFAQPSLSHDGNTWAIGTAFLYLQNESLGPESCALFLVDLSGSNRPVTKVPIPVPPQRKQLIH
jgi:hypothetical protein